MSGVTAATGIVVDAAIAVEPVTVNTCRTGIVPTDAAAATLDVHDATRSVEGTITDPGRTPTIWKAGMITWTLAGSVHAVTGRFTGTRTGAPGKPTA